MKNNKKNKKYDIHIDQAEFGITKRNYLERVIGVQEACEILNIDTSYLHKLIKKGEFENWEYKAIGKFKIFLRTSIENRKDTFKTYTKRK